MSFRSRAAFGGAFLALAIAPAAEAAKKPASFKVRSLAVSDASVAPGDAVRVTGKVRNTKGRKASSARVVYSLRTSRSAKSGDRLDSEGVERTKGGKSRSFSARVDIPSSTGPGTYFLTVCVNRSGVKKAKCSRTELTVALPPTPAPPTPPAPPAPPAPPEPDTRSVSEKLRTAITTEGMGKHLEALQAIATDNGGNRASGFQGYGASVQYVLQTLRGAGYNATSQVFDFVTFAENTDPVLEQTAPTPRTFGEDEFLTMSYSASGDATGALDAIDVKIAGNEADSTSGCEDADFAGFTDGDIALMQRGTCPFVDKVVNAQEAGAAGAVVFNQGNDPGRVGVVAGTLGEPAQDGVDPDVEIPATGISYALGKELAQTAGAAVHMVVDATSDQRKSTNVIADTPTGSADDVVLVGSHLDSVPEGPGINDNGSGSAYNLELAVQMAKLGITPENKVRFAFWGAEESGLVGSTRYVEAATEESFAQLAAVLNFDMLASPNHATFVYDGDFSNTPEPATAPGVNPGAAAIEQDFEKWFASAGQHAEPSAFDGRSDYKAFQDQRVPAGGLFSGAEVAKNESQAAQWGGTAGEAFDPNYHQAGDDINNLDLAGYKIMSDAASDVLAKLAGDPDLRTTLEAGRTPKRASRSATPVVRAGGVPRLAPRALAAATTKPRDRGGLRAAPRVSRAPGRVVSSP